MTYTLTEEEFKDLVLKDKVREPIRKFLKELNASRICKESVDGRIEIRVAPMQAAWDKLHQELESLIK